MLAEAITIDDAGESITAAQRIARIVIERALTGDQWAIQFVADRIEGRPPLAPADIERMSLPPVVILGRETTTSNNGDEY